MICYHNFFENTTENNCFANALHVCIEIHILILRLATMKHDLSVTTAFRLTRDEFSQLKKVARAAGMRRSDFIRTALNDRIRRALHEEAAAAAARREISILGAGR